MALANDLNMATGSIWQQDEEKAAIRPHPDICSRYALESQAITALAGNLIHKVRTGERIRRPKNVEIVSVPPVEGIVAGPPIQRVIAGIPI